MEQLEAAIPLSPWQRWLWQRQPSCRVSVVARVHGVEAPVIEERLRRSVERHQAFATRLEMPEGLTIPLQRVGAGTLDWAVMGGETPDRAAMISALSDAVPAASGLTARWWPVEPQSGCLALSASGLVADRASLLIVLSELHGDLSAEAVGEPLQLLEFVEWVLEERAGVPPRSVTPVRVAGEPSRIELEWARPSGWTDERVELHWLAVARTLAPLLGVGDDPVGVVRVGRRPDSALDLVGPVEGPCLLPGPGAPAQRVADFASQLGASCEVVESRLLELGDTPSWSLVIETLPSLPSWERPGSRVEAEHVAVHGDPSPHLVLRLSLHPERLDICLEYDAAKLGEPNARAWLEGLSAAWQRAARDPALSVGALRPEAADPAQELVEYHDRLSEGAPGRTFLEMFLEQLARCPHEPAVEHRGRRLTYAELARASHGFALCLRARGVSRGSLVGVCMPRGLELVVGLLGILRAGAAYVGIDASFPAARRREIVVDAGLRVLVAPQALAAELGELALQIVEPSTLAAECESLEALSPVPPTELAYVMYTSGSTGTPKGVEVPHAALGNYLTAVARAIPFGECRRMGTLASVATDLGHTVTFGALAHGRTLCLPDDDDILDAERFARWLDESRVELIKIVPSHLMALLAALPRPTLGALTCIISGGEALSAGLVQQLRDIEPRCRIFNHYGPTETTVGALTHEVRAEDLARARIPIGRALPGYVALVVRADGALAAPGESGELLLGGLGVAAGYLHRAELTEQRFVAARVGRPNLRVYRTGDVVSVDGQNHLHFVGRNDDQIKIRGVRIELGEIVAHLERVPGVREAAVSVHDTAGGERELVAYVAPESADPASLRDALRARLPEVMVPARILCLPALPRASNGKIDRAHLRIDAPRKLDAGAGFSSAERPIASLWAEVLGHGVEPDDNFFDHGGHSLKATQLVARLRRLLGLSVEVADVFEAPTVRSFARRVLARSASVPLVARASIPRRELTRGPLSASQRRMWVLDRLGLAGASYNVHGAYVLRGELDRAALQGAIGDVMARHEIVRTRLSRVDDDVLQVVGPLTDSVLPEREVAADQVQGEALAWSRQHFELDGGALFRPLLLRVGPRHHVLLVCMHHVISDGWSTGVFVRELSLAYTARCSGARASLPVLPIQYLDYAVWQADWLRGEECREQLAYWKGKFATLPEPVALPSDRVRPQLPRFVGAKVPIEIDSELGAALRALARAEDMSLFMLLLAAYALLLSRETGQSDLCIGTPVANRSRPEFEGLMGCFMNSLPLRLEISPELSLRELRRRVRAEVLEAQRHQDVPFDRVVQDVHAVRDPALSPLYQVMLILQSEPAAPPALPGLELSPLHLDVGVSKLDLSLELRERGQGLIGHFEFDTDRFDTDQIEAMVRRYIVALEAQLSHGARSCEQVSLLDDAERAQLAAWNEIVPAGEGDALVAEQVWHSVSREPSAVAVVDAEHCLDYAQLGARIAVWADILRQHGVRHGDRVGTCLGRSVDLAVLPIAVWSLGAVYVPLDPHASRERLDALCAQAGVRRVCCDVSTFARVSALAVEPLSFVPRSGVATACARVALSSSDAAYVLFTSGSSGRPKGVVIEHGNLRSFMAGMRLQLGSEPPRWLALTAASFDISLLELLYPLTLGGRVVVGSGPLDAVVAAPGGDAGRDVDIGLFYFASASEQGRADCYRLLREGSRFADAHGFCAVWTPERHFGKFGGIYPNPAVAGAAVAAWTQKVEIRAGSCVLPLHSPLRVAEEWAVVDNLSNGRVSLSFASGWHPHDFALAPAAYADRRNITFERLEQVRRAWRGEALECETGDGKRVALRTQPRPVRPELPVWITSAGTPATFARAGEVGAFLLTHLLGQSLQGLGENIRAYREAWARSGRDPAEARVALMVHTYLHASAEKARELARAPFREYLRDSIELVQPLARQRGVDPRQCGPEDLEALLDHACERYMETSGLFGDLEQGLAFVERVRALGVDELACLIDFGLSDQLVLESLPHLARLREIANAGSTPQRSLAQLLTEHRISHLQCTPTLARWLLDEPSVSCELGQLEALLVGGEAWDIALAGRLRQAGVKRLLNVYGPTEATIWVSADEVEAGEITLGRPLANCRLRVVNGHGQELPPGIDGELIIEGACVGRGYLEQEPGQREAFFTTAEGARGYRTGDRVRRRRDGRIVYRGRFDRQVKIRGHRVELGEIEACLSGVEGVLEAAVELREVQGQQRLIAFVVAPGLADDALRAAAAKRLPSHMQPQQIVALERLPSNASGKVDRKALAALELGSVPARAVEGEAPCGAVEEALSEIWSQLLGRREILRHDNFFELGGDSIIGIQMVGKARARGIAIAPREVFRRQTIAELASVARRLVASTEEQEPLDGACPLLPAQSWFLQQHRVAGSHYVQSLWLDCPAGMDLQHLRAAWEAVTRHHDALRLRVTCHEGCWQQRFASSPSSRIEVIELPPQLEAECDDFVAATVNGVSAELDIDRGPTSACIAFRGFPGGAVRLWLMVHHLWVDGVSWRILVEDLERALEQCSAGRVPELPAKTTSVRAWAEALKAYAQGLSSAEREHWQHVASYPVAPLPRDADGCNGEGDVEVYELALDEAATRRFLRRGQRDGGPQALLLASLAAAIRGWSGAAQVKVELEGHGRELEGCDASRTVGWLTSMYPVLVDLEGAHSLLDVLQRSSRALEARPGEGLGFGVLRYLSEPDGGFPLVPAEVQLNYLGQVGEAGRRAGLSMRSGNVGQPRDSQQERSHLLNVIGLVRDSRLRVQFHFGKHVHRTQTIQRLAAELEVSLLELLGGEARRFELAALEPSELEDVVNELAAMS